MAKGVSSPTGLRPTPHPRKFFRVDLGLVWFWGGGAVSMDRLGRCRARPAWEARRPRPWRDSRAAARLGARHQLPGLGNRLAMALSVRSSGGGAVIAQARIAPR